MKVTRKEERDATIFEIEGEIADRNTFQLRKIFDEFVKEVPQKVVVDLSEVQYIDSSGIAVLVRLHVRLKVIGGSVHLCSPSEPVRGIFNIADLNAIFPTYDTMEDALADF